MKSFHQSQGFTLLEMLIALTLGAMLMAMISTSVTPLFTQTKTQALSYDAYSTENQLQSFSDELDRLAKASSLVFPHALDSGVSKNSLALQLKGTGFDMPADSNGDGSAGVANMDSSANRDTAASSSDDDNDGVNDEDPINGLDDDNDGLTDEDPGRNNDDGDNDVSGIANYDDNGDGIYDDAMSKVEINEEAKFWSPFLPASFVTENQLDNNHTYSVTSGASYQRENDDNEDGVTNNNPMLTWSARQSGNTIICTTPFVEHSDSENYSTVIYHDYTCMEGVESFSATRSYSASGTPIIEIELTYQAAGIDRKYSKTVSFQ